MKTNLDKTGVLSLFSDGERCDSEILADLEHIANSLTDLEFFTMLLDIYQTKKGISKHLGKIVNFLKNSYELIERHQEGQKVAYLKRQMDGRYTINTGLIHDSGYDIWFSTEATTEKGAKQYFNIFKEIWFRSDVFSLDKTDALSEIDIYQLVGSEIQNYY